MVSDDEACIEDMDTHILECDMNRYGYPQQFMPLHAEPMPVHAHFITLASQVSSIEFG